MTKTFKLFAGISLFILAGCNQTIQDLRPGARYEPMTHSTAQMAAPYSPSHGRALHCLIERGSVRFESGWNDADRVSFRLARGHRTQVALTRRRGDEQSKIIVHYDQSGQKLLFCPLPDPNKAPRVECASLYALEDDFAQGFRRTLDIPGTLRGGQVRCSLNASFLTGRN